MTNIDRDESIIFGLSTCKEIAKEVSKLTKITLGEMIVKRFADRELFVESKSTIRNKKAFVIQSTSSPANDNLMELLLVIDALKRSSVKEVNLIIPYFGYARQDRRANGRQSISAKLVANMLTIAGADRIITFDIHSEQIAGFFDIPFDNLRGSWVIADEIKKMNIKDLVIVSPDHGGVSRARSFAKLLGNAPLAVIDKRKIEHNKPESMFILGNVNNKNVIIYDDMVDTGGTVEAAFKKLKSDGAKDIYLSVTHPVLSNEADEKLEKIGIKKLITTNSIKREESEFILQIDLSDVISDIIINHLSNKSITENFINKYSSENKEH